jgi:glycosyltransferase involved in cell wall biosynthesis
LVSVVIPAFNAQETLPETLASVRAQTHGALEILIIDDGSTDATARIAAAFCAENSHARLMSTPNRGVAAARNLGIAEARGKFVAPLDADDVWHPGHLSLMIQCALEAPALPGFVFAHSRQIDRNTNILRSSPPVAIAGKAIRQLAYRNFVGNGSALLLSRAAAVEAGGYDERLRAAGLEGCEDYLLQLKIAARHPIASIPEFTVGYRQRPDAMSSDAVRMFGSSALAYALFRDDFPELDIAPFVRRWYRASRGLVLARYHMRSRRPVAAMRKVVVAVLDDPVGALAALAYDFERVAATRPFRRADAGAAPMSFHEFPIAAASAGSALDPPARPRLMHRLELSRMNRLAAIDRADRADRPKPEGTR